MKIYEIDFEKIGCIDGVLIIAAKSENEALEIAEETLQHTHPSKATLIKTDNSKVIYFFDSNY